MKDLKDQSNAIKWPKGADALMITSPKGGKTLLAKKLCASIDPTVEVAEFQFGAMVKQKGTPGRHFAPLAVQPGHWTDQKAQPNAPTAPPSDQKKAPKAKRAPKAEKPAKAEKEQSKTGWIDEQILTGKHSAREIAKLATEKFGGKEDKNLVIVRSRPWHLKRKGLKPHLKPEHRDGKVAFLREMFTTGKTTVPDAAKEAVAKFGGDLDKTKVVVRSLAWHFKKQGVKGHWAKIPKAA